MGILPTKCKAVCAGALLFLATALAGGKSCAGNTEVLLTVEIASSTSGQARIRHFTRSDLEALPRAAFRTHTLWTSGVQHFEGLWLATLLETLGVTSGELTLRAINDYKIRARAEDFAEGGALLAYSRNATPMSPRDKGPLWLVWNYDAVPEFRTESIYALSVWQLDRIRVSR